MSHQPAAQMQLFFRLENVADVDWFSKSDPYCILESAINTGGSSSKMFASSTRGNPLGGSTRGNPLGSSMMGKSSMERSGMGNTLSASNNLTPKNSFVNSAGSPKAVGSVKGDVQNCWSEVGRTEVIWNNLNPKFHKSIHVNYFFEQTQLFRLRIFDEDENKDDESNDKLGYVEFHLSHIVKSRGHVAEFPLKPRGKVFITAMEEATGGNDRVELCFGARCLKNTTYVNKAPSFKLYRILPNGATHLLHSSTRLDQTGQVSTWETIKGVCVNDLTTKNLMDPTLLFESFTPKEESLGAFKCSFGSLLEAVKDPTKSFKLLDNKMKRYGEVFVSSCKVIHVPTFADYLRGGFEISGKDGQVSYREGFEVNLAVAINFAGRDYTNPASLHYMGAPGGKTFLNQYVRSMTSVGNILMEYDKDKQVPVFGFGAELPNQKGSSGSKTSHFFPCNFNSRDPSVHAVEGVKDVYATCLQKVKPGSPSNFAPMIQNVAKLANDSANVYTILLILTDGEISDMEETVDAVVEASTAPLSIVIVGVGDCDFEEMHILDGDKDALTSSAGVETSRDIVQFVPFKRFDRAPPEALAVEVLAEIPNQFVQWAQHADLTGNAPAEAKGWAPMGADEEDDDEDDDDEDDFFCDDDEDD